MTDLITEARELCEAATPGPWYVHESHNWHKDPPKEYFVITRGAKEIVASWVETSNAQFIARSRTLIPELCNALEKAKEQNKQLLREVSNLAAESVKRDVTLARLEAEVMQLWEAQRWTDAEYDTPDIGQAVLLYMPDKETDNVRTGEYIGEGDYRIGNKLYRGMEIDAWQPLPAAPEGEEKHE